MISRYRWILASVALVAAMARAHAADEPATDDEVEQKYAVTVYKWDGKAWQKQLDRAFQTTNPLKALRYATQVKIVRGWHANTDATYDVSRINYWIYPKDEHGKSGFWIHVKDQTWGEMKDNEVYALFTEIAHTSEYVELYDANRSMSLRLYATEAKWKTDDQENWSLLPFIIEPQGHAANEALLPDLAAIPPATPELFIPDELKEEKAGE